MKIFAWVLALVVALVFSLNPYSDYMVKEGLKNNDGEKCMQGAALKRRLAKYQEASLVYKKIKREFWR